MNTNIPNAVKEAAKDLIDLYGENIKLIGTYQDKDVYMYQFPEGCFTGFPFIFLHNKDTDQAIAITGFEAVDILAEIG